MIRVMQNFFSAWDVIETMHPFGVQRFTPLFRDFGVSSQLCVSVDECLYLDLMVSIYPNVRRIKIEDRRSSRIKWVYVELLHSAVLVGFQRSPSDRFEYLTVVDALPQAFVALVVSYFFRSQSTGGYCGRMHMGCNRRPRLE